MIQLRFRYGFYELKSLLKKLRRIIKPSWCTFSFVKIIVKAVTLILFYYILSIGLTFYNRHVFKNSKFALSVTMCHLIIKFAIASFARLLWECKTKTARIILDWDTFIRCVAPAGFVSSLDIGLSNWSFEMITVSLYTMSKSTVVVFILFFSLVFRLEKFQWSSVVVVLFIFTGVLMFTYKSTQFNLTGFILVMSASVLAGLRWTLAQILLQKDRIGLHNPLDMMYHIQPWMILALLPLCIGLEGRLVATSDQYFRFSDWSVLMNNISMILFGGCMGFMLEFSEFLFLSYTSSLTFAIAGIFKETFILSLAYLVNHDSMNIFNAVGLVVSILGIIIHIVTRAIFRKNSISRVYRKPVQSIQMLPRKDTGNEGLQNYRFIKYVDQHR